MSHSNDPNKDKYEEILQQLIFWREICIFKLHSWNLTHKPYCLSPYNTQCLQIKFKTTAS